MIFPVIENIEQIRTAIRNRDEFLEIQRDDHIVFDYVIQKEDTFPKIPFYPDPYFELTEQAEQAALLRECRGIIFCKQTGKVIRRPFHKFFNLNERPECDQSILFSRSYVLRRIHDKLDGTMIAPFISNGKIRWGTMKGITNFTPIVENHILYEKIKNERLYNEFAEEYIKSGMTPIFEWCSPDNQIVVKYKQDQLSLLAVREMRNGLYRPFEFIKNSAGKYNIPFVNIGRHLHPNETDDYSINRHIDSYRSETDKEGYVLVFVPTNIKNVTNDILDETCPVLVKVKNDWYVRIHKSKERISLEKNVWNIVLNDEQDDLIAMLVEPERSALERFANDLNQKIIILANEIKQEVKSYKQKYRDDRKSFALEVVNKLNDPFRKSLLWNEWNEKDTIQSIKNLLVKNCSSKTKVEQVRHLLGGICWEDYYNLKDLDDF